MFGIRKVGDKEQDQPQRAPPTHMLTHQQRIFTPTSPRITQRLGKGAPPIGPMLRHGKTITQQPKANMKKDKETNDQRVAADGTGLYAVVQFDIAAVFERRALHDKAAQQKIDHAEEHRRRSQISQQAVELTKRPRAQKGDGEETL